MRFAIPLVVLAGLVAVFFFALQHDPRELPSPLLGKAAPAFELPVLAFPATAAPPLRLTAADLRGRPLLVNFFASWCGGCQVEHPFLMQLAQAGGVQLVGIDYKDAEADVRAWLQQKGNPYAPILADLEGRVGIDWGVYGVPETFVLNAEGVIVYKHVGPLTPDAWQTIRPLLGRTS
ncbi:MAG: DsbE family thiol:disulfide interchange protein [Nevskia sp.]